MNIHVCEDCGFEVKCSSCHSDCPRCGGDIKTCDYVRYKLDKAKKNGTDNTTR